MSDHLPECPASGTGGDIYHLCICDRLRACEQRVREDDNRALWDQRQFNAGLAAARDAVVALPYGSPLDDALAAIDALRGDA